MSLLEVVANSGTMRYTLRGMERWESLDESDRPHLWSVWFGCWVKQ